MSSSLEASKPGPSHVPTLFQRTFDDCEISLDAKILKRGADRIKIILELDVNDALIDDVVDDDDGGRPCRFLSL